MMKKSLAAVLIFSMIFIGVSCGTAKEFQMDEWLAPYLEIVDEINEEHGWTLSIVDQDAFYRAYKDSSLEEAKKDIEKTYLESLAGKGGASGASADQTNSDVYRESAMCEPSMIYGSSVLPY